MDLPESLRIEAARRLFPRMWFDAAATEAGPAPDDPPKTIKPSRRSVILMVVVALVGVLAILYAWQLWPFSGRVAVTENAYVRGQITVLAPQVNGYVTEVLVQDFERVAKGQTLVRIDDRQYRQTVEQRRAELAARRFDLENLEQTLASNEATLASRRAELSSTEAELQRALADEKRVNELAQRGSVSIRERDQIRAGARAGIGRGRRRLRRLGGLEVFRVLGLGTFTHGEAAFLFCCAMRRVR